MTAPIATALPSRFEVLLIDAPPVNGDGLGGGTGVPFGEPEPEPVPVPVPVPVPTGPLPETVPEATTTEVALDVGKGAALVL